MKGDFMMKKQKKIYSKVSSIPAKMLAVGRFPNKVYRDRKKYTRKVKHRNKCFSCV